MTTAAVIRRYVIERYIKLTRAHDSTEVSLSPSVTNPLSWKRIL